MITIIKISTVVFNKRNYVELELVYLDYLSLLLMFLETRANKWRILFSQRIILVDFFAAAAAAAVVVVVVV